MNAEKVIALLGQPSRSHRDKRFNTIFYDCDGGGFWAVWFFRDKLLNFEFRGGVCRSLPSWFQKISRLDLSIEGLRTEGFSCEEDGDGIRCSLEEEDYFCEAIFFDDSFDRLIFGWREEVA